MWDLIALRQLFIAARRRIAAILIINFQDVTDLRIIAIIGTGMDTLLLLMLAIKQILLELIALLNASLSIARFLLLSFVLAPLNVLVCFVLSILLVALGFVLQHLLFLLFLPFMLVRCLELITLLEMRALLASY